MARQVEQYWILAGNSFILLLPHCQTSLPSAYDKQAYSELVFKPRNRDGCDRKGHLA